MIRDRNCPLLREGKNDLTERVGGQTTAIAEDINGVAVRYHIATYAIVIDARAPNEMAIDL